LQPHLWRDIGAEQRGQRSGPLPASRRQRIRVITPITSRRDIEAVANRWVNVSKRSSVKAPRSFCEVSCPDREPRRVRVIEHHDQRLRRVYRPFRQRCARRNRARYFARLTSIS
jgi:hypothetical protein